MLPFINILGAAIALSPLILIAGIWLGASLAEKHAVVHHLTGEKIFYLIFTGLIAYILGGRVSFALQHPAAFSSNLLNLFSRNFGLFDIWGGLVIAFIAILIYGQRKKMNTWQTLDALTPALAVFMLAVPLANLASGEAFGAPSELPWAIELWGMTRHPVQLYETLGAGVILWLFWPEKKKNAAVPGLRFLQFAGFSAAARLFFEGFRGNSLVISDLNMRLAQLVAWLVLAAAIWLYQSRQTRHGSTDE